MNIRKIKFNNTIKNNISKLTLDSTLDDYKQLQYLDVFLPTDVDNNNYKIKLKDIIVNIDNINSNINACALFINIRKYNNEYCDIKNCKNCILNITKNEKHLLKLFYTINELKNK